MPRKVTMIPTMPADEFLTGNPLEHGFARLPRPQRVLDPTRLVVPTRSALLQAEAQSKRRDGRTPAPMAPPPQPAPLPVATSPHVSQGADSSKSLAALKSTMPDSDLHALGPVITLGTFAQDNVKWAHAPGLAERKVLEGLNHRNIAKLVHSFIDDSTLGLALEYCRFTLAEVLHVHLKPEEQHVQYIARSIFDALAYLGQRGITHNHVDARSIRITTPDLRVVLSNFEHAASVPVDRYPNHDLVDLGLTLLECMEGHLLSDDRRNFQMIKKLRNANSVFGLSNAEQWSGSKQLVDFLEDLFNEERSAQSKITKPHRFVSSKRDHYDCLRPYIELVTLECFTLWLPAQ